MNKLALVIDKNESFLSLQKTQLLDMWNLTDYVTISSVSEIAQPSLFGNPLPSVIKLSDTETTKRFTESLTKETNDKERLAEIAKWGLIILSDANRTTLKKLEKLIITLGGTVVEMKNEKNSTTVDKILDELHLNYEAKSFLKDYAGDSYEKIISVVRTVSTLTPKQQQRIQVADLVMRLPQPAGVIAPWEIDKPLFTQKSIPDTIATYKRITINTHPLVITTLLKNKFLLSYKIAALLQEIPNLTQSKAAKLLNVSDNYPFKLAYNQAKMYGFAKIHSVLTKTLVAESKMKGSSTLKIDQIMQPYLIELCKELKQR